MYTLVHITVQKYMYHSTHYMLYVCFLPAGLVSTTYFPTAKQLFWRDSLLYCSRMSHLDAWQNNALQSGHQP